MNKRLANSGRCKRLGTATVEFAMVLPIILLVIFGIIEFSRFCVIKSAGDQIAYEACRVGIAIGADKEDVKQKIDEMLASNFIIDVSATITPDRIDGNTGSVRVEVNIPLAQNSWGLHRFFSDNLVCSCTLDHESEIRRRRLVDE